MSEAANGKNLQTAPRKRYNFAIELSAVAAAFILSVIGIGITNFRPEMSYRYWGAMTFILASAAIVLGWAKQQREGQPVKEMLFTQLVHWVATLAAVAAMFMLLHAGRLNYENTGLVVLVTLALATFLDGYRVSWGFSALGIMMFIAAMIGAYIEQYVLVILVVVVCTAVVIIILERAGFKKSRSSAQDK